MSEELPLEPPAIQIQGLSYSYGSGQTVLADITLSVARGERLALVGPSGAGKSTLLMHLNGLLPDRLPRDSERASVVVGGVPVRKSTVSEVRRVVGFVFQDPDDQLFCPTVREDVAFGPLNLGLSRDDVLRRISRSLDQVGLAGFENRSTLQLSTGERKRVCLAGVLACHPEVLVLDEPFANLDPRARRGLGRILREFPGAQVIATHDIEFVVELCDRVIILDGGQIRADGPVREVLSDELLIAQHGLEVPWCLRRAEG
ncbi:MAG: ABC transporter ATP-binding protein [Planctomycetota bacterium]|nr:ABC transporter ATP-binding protein [Planctomycetota bacterium]MDA1164993.1 ABC transporter ATP-binding protein [Planctomycetota bacterium]